MLAAATCSSAYGFTLDLLIQANFHHQATQGYAAVWTLKHKASKSKTDHPWMCV